MRAKRLYRKTFETKDANGVYFLCDAYYNQGAGDENIYRARGLNAEARTLPELKIKVGSITTE